MNCNRSQLIHTLNLLIKLLKIFSVHFFTRCGWFFFIACFARPVRYLPKRIGFSEGTDRSSGCSNGQQSVLLQDGPSERHRSRCHGQGKREHASATAARPGIGIAGRPFQGCWFFNKWSIIIMHLKMQWFVWILHLLSNFHPLTCTMVINNVIWRDWLHIDEAVGQELWRPGKENRITSGTLCRVLKLWTAVQNPDRQRVLSRLPRTASQCSQFGKAGSLDLGSLEFSLMQTLEQKVWIPRFF